MLTKVQKETLNYMQECFFKKGYMPTLSEMAEHFGIKRTSMQGRIENIKNKKYIKGDGKRLVFTEKYLNEELWGMLNER